MFFHLGFTSRRRGRNEWRVITAGLILMQEIARGEISADAETKAECSKYFIPIGILLSKLPELPS